MMNTKNLNIKILIIALLALVIAGIAFLAITEMNKEIAVSPAESVPVVDSVPVASNNEELSPEEPIVLEGTEQYKAGWSEGKTRQEVVDQIYKDSFQESKDEIKLEGTEQYKAGWSEGMTKQQVVDQMNKDTNQENAEDGVIILEGTDI